MRPYCAGWLCAEFPAGAAAAAASDRVLLRFKASAEVSASAALPGVVLTGVVGVGRGGAAAAVSSGARPPPGAVYVFRISDGSRVAAKVAQLSRHPLVDVAEPDYILMNPPVGEAGDEQPMPGVADSGGADPGQAAPFAAGAGQARVPDDPRFQPGLRYSGQWYLQQIRAPSAWGLSTGSKQVGGVGCLAGCGAGPGAAGHLVALPSCMLAPLPAVELTV